MNTKAFFRVALWAAGAFAMALPLVLPHSLNAVIGNEKSSLIQPPALVLKGCQLSTEVVNGYDPAKPEGKPLFSITAINTTETDADLDLSLTAVARSVSEPMRRVASNSLATTSFPIRLYVPANQTVTTQKTWDDFPNQGRSSFTLTLDDDTLTTAMRKAQKQAENQSPAR